MATLSLHLPADFLASSTADFPDPQSNPGLRGCWFEGLEDAPLLFDDGLAQAWETWVMAQSNAVDAAALSSFFSAHATELPHILQLRSEFIGCWLVLQSVN